MSPANQILVALLAFLAHAQAQTLSVPSAAFPTIQSAISAASPGDLVLVAPGTYFENLVWTAGDITVKGAGPGLSIIDGFMAGPCVRFNNTASAAATLEGFTLVNGIGQPVAGFPYAGGGGILFDSVIGYPNPTIRNCEITACSALVGAALWIRLGSPTFEDVHVHGCNTGNGPGVLPQSVVFVDSGSAWPTMSNCRFSNNQGHYVVYVTYGSYLIQDCLFDGNMTLVVTFRGSQAYYGQLRRCRFTGNSSLTPPAMASGVLLNNAYYGEISDCLFDSNVVGGGIAEQLTSSPSSMQNCTFAHNTITGVGIPTAVAAFGGFADLENAIIRGNVDATGAPMTSPVFVHPNTATLITHSNIENGLGLGPNVIDANPFFVDPAGGDFRLSPGSPSIDAGTSTTIAGISATDFRGLPRVRMSAIDHGAFEAWESAHLPSSAGTIGQGLGGPYDLLLVNGSAGNALREVVLPVGAAATISLGQPPHLSQPVDFSIFGLLDDAAVEFETLVPLGIGPMSFPPAPLLPYLQPLLFTAASTIGPINAVAPITPAGQTPWTAPPFSVPFPLSLSFQAVIDEGGGVFRASNLVVLEFR